MKNKYLPIGTVVKLDGSEKTLMIIGYAAIDFTNKNKMYDYSACTFPAGVISSKETLLFNHSQIKEVLFEGYADDEQTNFSDTLNKIMTEENIKKMLAEINK